MSVKQSSKSNVAKMDNSCITLNDLYNYTCGDKGLLLPLVTEYTWPHAVRAFLYMLGMLWCFLGIAIIADVFMCSIEKITSYTRTVKIASPDPETIGFEEVEVKVRLLFMLHICCLHVRLSVVVSGCKPPINFIRAPSPSIHKNFPAPFLDRELFGIIAFVRRRSSVNFGGKTFLSENICMEN